VAEVDTEEGDVGVDEASRLAEDCAISSEHYGEVEVKIGPITGVGIEVGWSGTAESFIGTGAVFTNDVGAILDLTSKICEEINDFRTVGIGDDDDSLVRHGDALDAAGVVCNWSGRLFRLHFTGVIISRTCARARNSGCMGAKG